MYGCKVITAMVRTFGVVSLLLLCVSFYVSVLLRGTKKIRNFAAGNNQETG